MKAVLVADRPEDDPLLHGWDVPLLSDGGDDGTGGAPSGGLGDGRLLDSVLGDAAVIVDGILGTGIKGAPQARQAMAIQAINRSPRPVFALDAPSGIDADTGRIDGEAVAAQVTVALGWPKLGTFLQPARTNVGR